MKLSLRRFLKYTAFSLLALLALVFIGVVIWGASSLPRVRGEETLQTLNADVQIYRDKEGIPHIFAQNKGDAFAALGFVHAQDRLFQMDMMRRAGQGRLAEVLGKDLVNYDRKNRTLGFGWRAQEKFKALAPDAQAALQSYADGVNAFLKHGPFPPEFALLGITPEPWQPWHSILWAELMSWQLSHNYEGEVFRQKLLDAGWSKKQIEALYPPTDENVPVTTLPLEGTQGRREEGTKVGFEGSQVRGFGEFFSSVPTVPAFLRPFENLPNLASNAYVLAGKRTASGKPLLANDPHLQLQAPVLWYLARLVTPDWEIKGATAPGVPFFPLAQNQDVAWGFTTSALDSEDIVFLDTKKTPLTTRDEVIRVKGAAPVSVQVRSSVYGPVISDVLTDVAQMTPQGKVAVLQFTAFTSDDRTVESLYRINTAKNVQDIRAALALYTAPAQNLLYADLQGHIGYALVGVAPLRSGNGFYAADNKPWQGLAARRITPHLADPPQGVLMTANNAPVNKKNCAAFSCALAAEWPEPYRALRLEPLLKDAHGWSVSDAAQPMLDVVSVAATRLLPQMLARLEEGRREEGQGDEEILKALRQWNGAMLKDRAEPLIFHALRMQLMKRAFEGAAVASLQSWPSAMALEKKIATLPLEMVEESWHGALKDLRQRYGEDWRGWRWGQVHKAPLENALWSRIPVIGSLVSIAVETDGDGYTLNRAASSEGEEESFTDQHGPGYRSVYDVADPSRSLFMIATGESGNIFSKHYGNFTRIWARGHFVTLQGQESDFAQKHFSHLILRAPAH
jgi:penicillin amidase